MNNLKPLVFAFCLVSVFAVTTFAGETPTMPCAPPDPGETHGPPCPSAQLATDDLTNPGETPAPPATETVVTTAVVDAAVGAFLTIW